MAGVERCDSALGCVWCGATVAAHLRDCVGTSIARHATAGGVALFVTVAVPHRRTDSLVAVQEIVDGLVRHLFTSGQCRPVSQALARLGAVERVFTSEWMWGQRNGWGAHQHGVLYVDGAVDQDAVNQLVGKLALAGMAYLERQGWHAGVARHLVKVEMVRDGRGTAEYLLKAGLELTGGATKEGRSGETMTVRAMAVELADLVGGEDLADARECPVRGERVRLLVALLREWESSTKGRHALSTSRGWWDRFLPEVTERSASKIVRAGRDLEVRDRAMVRDAAAELARTLGREPDPEPEEVPGTVGVAEPEAAAVRELAVERTAWAEFDRAVGKRLAGYRLVLEVLHRTRYGTVACACELVEDFGAEQAARLIAATLPDAPPVWRAADGTIVVAARCPEGEDWDLVEDWGITPAAGTWLDRWRERKGDVDVEAERKAEARFRRSLEAEQQRR